MLIALENPEHFSRKWGKSLGKYSWHTSYQSGEAGLFVKGCAIHFCL